MAHDTSPSIGEVHQAAVLVPPALPSERHESVGPLTTTWPSRLVPVGLPPTSTKASRAACAGASGHGWFARHVPSDRKSDGQGKSVSVRVNLGGRRFIKKK